MLKPFLKSPRNLMKFYAYMLLNESGNINPEDRKEILSALLKSPSDKYFERNLITEALKAGVPISKCINIIERNIRQENPPQEYHLRFFALHLQPEHKPELKLS